MAISQELVKFDMQLMCNPDIQGKEYQQGTLAGYETREYLLEKWGRQCAYCGVKDVALQIEHIHPRAKGGSNSITNLTLNCERCNTLKGTKDIKDFLKKDPSRLEKILAQAKKPLADAYRGFLMNYKDFFKEVTEFPPYPWQECFSKRQILKKIEMSDCLIYQES